MFVLKLSDTYEWPVKFSIPVDGGKHQPVEFKAVFRRRSQADIEALTNAGLTDAAFTREIVSGIRDIQDESGNDVTLETILGIPMAATALVMAYMESLKGAPRKN